MTRPKDDPVRLLDYGVPFFGLSPAVAAIGEMYRQVPPPSVEDNRSAVQCGEVRHQCVERHMGTVRGKVNV